MSFTIRTQTWRTRPASGPTRLRASFARIKKSAAQARAGTPRKTRGFRQTSCAVVVQRVTLLEFVRRSLGRKSTYFLERTQKLPPRRLLFPFAQRQPTSQPGGCGRVLLSQLPKIVTEQLYTYDKSCQVVGKEKEFVCLRRSHPRRTGCLVD